jgi:hypothetical protein
MHFHGALHLAWLDIWEARTEVPPFHFLLDLFLFSDFSFRISPWGRGQVETMELSRGVYLHAPLDSQFLVDVNSRRAYESFGHVWYLQLHTYPKFPLSTKMLSTSMRLSLVIKIIQAGVPIVPSYQATRCYC